MQRIKCYVLEETDQVRERSHVCSDPECTGHTYAVELWRDSRTGALVTLGEAEPGAMWRETHVGAAYTSQDDDPRVLMVRLPGGHYWCVDSVASNCNRKGEAHHCWVRSGTPPDVTAGKAGNTCSAGAGSILVPSYPGVNGGPGMPGWHGFLRGGYLEEC